MFYKYSNMLGRMTQSSQQVAYNPAGLQPLRAVESSKVVLEGSATRVASMATEASVPHNLPASEIGNCPNTKAYKNVQVFQEFAVKQFEAARIVWLIKRSDKAAMLGIYVVTTAVGVLTFSNTVSRWVGKK